MKKQHLLIGVFAASVAFTANAEAGVDNDLARGKSPVQAASAAFANGDDPASISRALNAAGVSRAVAANSVATAPRASFGGRDSDRDRPSVDRGQGYDLAQAIHRYKRNHGPGRGLAEFIAFFKVLAGWHGHHPGGPSPS